jgi:hypothetical protein
VFVSELAGEHDFCCDILVADQPTLTAIVAAVIALPGVGTHVLHPSRCCAAGSPRPPVCGRTTGPADPPSTSSTPSTSPTPGRRGSPCRCRRTRQREELSRSVILDWAEAAGVTRAGPGSAAAPDSSIPRRCSSGTCVSRDDAGQQLLVGPRRSRSRADVSRVGC